MTTVYWSPWYHDSNLYTDNYLTHYPIESVYKDLAKNKDSNNVTDNFFNCHAFKNFCKDMYYLRNPYTIDFEFISDQKRVVSKKPPGPNLMDLSVTTQIKQPSVKNDLTINYCVNWIFFADKPVTIQTLAPFMHDPEIYKTSYYVPGMYDISQWFRPFELALQMKPGQTTLKSYEGEPVVYVKFHSDEPIKLQRFYLTESLINHSTSCVGLKKFKAFKNLKDLYKVFTNTFLQQRILNEIKDNIIEK